MRRGRVGISKVVKAYSLSRNKAGQVSTMAAPHRVQTGTLHLRSLSEIGATCRMLDSKETEVDTRLL